MVGVTAIDFTLPDVDGRTRTLAELHRLGPLVLVFLPTVVGWRPRWQLWSLLRHYDRFIQFGAEIVVIANDPLPELRIHQIRGGFPFVFLCDRLGRVAADYEIAPGFAATLIINAHGVIRHQRSVKRGLRSSASSLLRQLGRIALEERLPRFAN